MLNRAVFSTVGLATETEYTVCSGENSPIVIQMHSGAVDGIVRDILENPRAESGGLLLGKVETSGSGSSRSLVRVEKYQRVPFTHSFNYAALEDAAADILSRSEWTIVGVYRSHLNPGFQPEPSDFEAADRYFNDPADLLLLIKPESGMDLRAQFYSSAEHGAFDTAGPLFPFRGRTVRAATIANMPESAPGPAPSGPAERPAQDQRPRRLVPDFVPEVVEPARSRIAPPLFASIAELPAQEPQTESWIRRWWPLGAALALLAGILFLVMPVQRSAAVKTPPAAQEPSRPLGLSVEPEGKTWTVSWNPNATALREPKSVQLFVREGDDQKRIELSPRDLNAGTYLYQPAGNDVTFRLEATEASGQITAESFRVMRTPAPTPQAPVAAAAPAPPRVIAPRAIHRVPPVVPASIRPRIKGKIPIDIRVKVDDRGRVISAAPAVHYPQGIDSYLAGRAMEAAREWRFEPAREDGKAIAGQETIHFVFEK